MLLYNYLQMARLKVRFAIFFNALRVSSTLLPVWFEYKRQKSLSAPQVLLSNTV